LSFDEKPEVNLTFDVLLEEHYEIYLQAWHRKPIHSGLGFCFKKSPTLT